MIRSLIIGAALLALAVPAQAAQPTPAEDAVVACLIGQAAVALRKNYGRWSKLDANAMTDAAQASIGKRCKGPNISEAGGDFVYRLYRHVPARRCVAGGCPS